MPKIKKIKKTIKEPIFVKGTIRVFKLAGWITEKTLVDGKNVLDIIRQAIKTNDASLLEMLVGKRIILGAFEKNNLIATEGREVLARLLSGDTTYSGEINYGALGTSTTPPNNNDTQLGTEVFRKIAASQTFDQNVAFIDFFYTAGDTSGTYEEFGNFIDGTAGADTGQLFSHILTGGWTKTGSESLFVSCQYTIN